MLIELAERHSFRLPTRCQSMIELSSSDEVEGLSFDKPYYLLGEGSNTLFVDDFEGQVICNRLLGVCIEEQQSDFVITAGAGENWHQFVRDLRQRDINGLENLALIPGSVGAAPVQNIGAYGVDVAAFIEQVRAWDIQNRCWRTLSAKACQFAYRDSVFKQQPGRWLITSVVFRLPKAWKPTLHYAPLNELGPDASARQIFDRVIEVRQHKLPDPKVIPNAGSFFKNPVIPKAHLVQLQQQWPDLVWFPLDEHQVKVAAGWLIDHLGLKAERVGGAGVNPRQALVLVNQCEATGSDVIALAKRIMAGVWQATGIRLEPEVRLVGRDGLLTLKAEV